MSIREQCNAILDTFDELQLVNAVSMLKTLKQAIEDAADDAFCMKLHQDYLNDPDHGDFVSFEDALKESGVSPDEL